MMKKYLALAIPFVFSLGFMAWYTGNPYGVFAGTVEKHELSKRAKDLLADKSDYVTRLNADGAQIEAELVRGKESSKLTVTLKLDKDFDTIFSRLRPYEDVATTEIASAHPNADEIQAALMSAIDVLEMDMDNNIHYQPSMPPSAIPHPKETPKLRPGKVTPFPPLYH